MNKIQWQQIDDQKLAMLMLKLKYGIKLIVYRTQSLTKSSAEDGKVWLSIWAETIYPFKIITDIVNDFHSNYAHKIVKNYSQTL